MPAIEVKNLVFEYEHSDSIAVNGVSFELKHGSYTVLAGMNGSGKSTIARIIAGLLKPKSGTVKIEEDLRVGIIFQSPKDQIVCGIVSQDTAFGPKNLDFSKSEVELNTIESLSAAGILELSDRNSMGLSLGQTQKVAFSGILAMDPDIVILDETLSMLDPESRKDFFNFVDAINSKGITVLHITHDIDAVERARDVLLMSKGKITWTGTSLDFFREPSLVEAVTGKKLEKNNKKFDSAGKKITFRVEDLSFSYDKKNPILKNVSFNLYEGSLTALVGPSGTGKSTLLEISAGLLKSDEGKIYCTHRPALAQQNSDSALFEKYAADDVAFGPRNNGLSGKALKEIVKNSMNLCNLDFRTFANRQTFCLSGGEKKRLAVAGIIALDSDVIFFDEPTAALDGESRYKMMQLLRNLAEQGKTVMFSTHQMDEADFADKVIDLGKLQEGGEGTEENRTALKELEPVSARDVLEAVQRYSWGKDGRGKKGIFKNVPGVLQYLLFAFIFGSSLLLRSLPLCGIGFFITFLYALLGGCSPKRLIISILKLVPLLLFFCIFQMVFAPPLKDEICFVNFRYFSVTPSKLILCLRTLLKTECALCLIWGFVNSMTEERLVKGFSDLLLPLKWLHLPVRYVTILMDIIFRFIPLLIDEACCIIKTQLIRGGLGKTKGFFGKLRAIIPLIVPLIIQTLKRAEALAEALTARGFK